MKEDVKYKLLSRGIFVGSNHPQIEERLIVKNNYPNWVYITGRVAILLLAVALFIIGSSAGMNGYWTLATICFIIRILFFIPFIHYGRKLKETKKSGNSIKGS